MDWSWVDSTDFWKWTAFQLKPKCSSIHECVWRGIFVQLCRQDFPKTKRLVVVLKGESICLILKCSIIASFCETSCSLSFSLSRSSFFLFSIPICHLTNNNHLQHLDNNLGQLWVFNSNSITSSSWHGSCCLNPFEAPFRFAAHNPSSFLRRPSFGHWQWIWQRQ